MPTTSVEDLPDEILDSVFAQFYPRETSPLLHRLPFHDDPPASDDLLVLLTCRLVSRTFDRIASSWAFRRFSLRLALHVREYNKEKALEKHAFLTRYDRLAAYVRIFTLSFDVAWHSPQIEGFFDVVELFRPFFEAMTGVHVMLLGGWNMGYSPRFNEIIVSLLQNKNNLEALYLDGLMVPALVELPPSLKMFHIRSEREQEADLYKSFISEIEALILGSVPDEIPWHSLRELAVDVQTTSTLEHIQNDLKAWCVGHPNRPIGLRELSMTGSTYALRGRIDWYTPFARALSEAGAKHTLRSLNVIGAWTGQYDEPDLFHQIGCLFPQLEELAIQDEWIVWNDMDPALNETMSHAYSGLARLRIIRHDSFILRWFVTTVEQDERDESEEYWRIACLRTLPVALPSLVEIRTRPLNHNYYYFTEDTDAADSLPAPTSYDEKGDVVLEQIHINMAGVITFIRDEHGVFERVKIENIEWQEGAVSLLTSLWRGDGGGEW